MLTYDLHLLVLYGRVCRPIYISFQVCMLSCDLQLLVLQERRCRPFRTYELCMLTYDLQLLVLQERCCCRQGTPAAHGAAVCCLIAQRCCWLGQLANQLASLQDTSNTAAYLQATCSTVL